MNGSDDVQVDWHNETFMNRQDQLSNPSGGSSELCKNGKGRKRRAPEEGMERVAVSACGSDPLPAFSNLGPFGPVSGFCSASSTRTPPPHSVIPPYMASHVGAEGNRRGLSAGELSGFYGGNIAAACEAANQEAAQKHKVASKDEDEEKQRKKAASRITAWQSRERKRIEMEVLQDRKAQLQRRNADLMIENEQLRLLITNVSTVTTVRVAQQPMSAPLSSTTASHWRGRSYPDTLARGPRGSAGSSVDAPQPLLGSNSVFESCLPFLRYPASALLSTSFLLQQHRQQQLQQQFQIRRHHYLGLPTGNLSGLQQGVFVQNGPGIADCRIYSGAFPAPTRRLLDIHESVSPLVRQQNTAPQQVLGPDSGRHRTSEHHPEPADTRGAHALDISSLLVPADDIRVDIPLVRAIPKRRESEAAKEESPEKKR